MQRQAGPPIVLDQQLGWVGRLPPRLRDLALLARWDRPIGTWLLLLPCWWGVALAPAVPDPWLFLLFAIGAVAMRGAGCTVNDLADREFDRMVERTRNRPLAAGRIGTAGAVAFFLAQSLVGIWVLTQLRVEAAIVALLSIPLIFVYPFMKRVTWWPQAFLGITFNWGALVGWTAVTGSLAAPAVLLYAAGFFWTLGYDTVYAHQDKDDDLLVGVKSTALRLGDRSRAWIGAFYTATVLLLAAAAWTAGLAWPVWPLLLVPAAMLAWQVATVDFDDRVSCLRHFRFHRDVGLAVLAALLAGRLAGLP